jgi:ABC-type multidrug transport system fused ATPase/permease subunit
MKCNTTISAVYGSILPTPSLQTYLFEIIGEKMTRRIRTDYFRALLRQDTGWFDYPANALGALTSRLAVDIKLIRLTVGQGTGSTVSSLTSLLAGFIIALIAAWQFALAFLATIPLLAVTEAINWALMKGGDSTSKKVSCKLQCSSLA